MRVKYRLADNINKVLVVIALIFVVATISISGCSEREPILPDDVTEKIKMNLGYALAPTWLPEGYEYAGPFPLSTFSDRTFRGESMSQSYGKDSSAAIGNSLIMTYPTDDIIPSAFQEIVDLVLPEDAITEIEINKNPAYLYQGSWSEETLGRVAKLEEPIDPEWDYDRNISIRFTIDVSDEGSIWVSISTIFSVEDITQKDLVKIARSVTVIE